jgi:hypothetical protein
MYPQMLYRRRIKARMVIVETIKLGQAKRLRGLGMTIPYVQHFDANLPSVAAPVRITSIYDAQIFTRRWVIRDKDRNLKTLLRKLEKANSGALIDEAMVDFKQALSARALLSAKS